MFGLKISFPKSSADDALALPVNLQNILMVIGTSVLSSEWRCLNLWYTAFKDGTFNEFRERRLTFSGKGLLAFAARVHQTVDGEFIAKKDGANKPWLIIKAVDSSWWEVWSSKPIVLEEIKNRFAKVSPIPNTGVEQALGADSP